MQINYEIMNTSGSRSNQYGILRIGCRGLFGNHGFIETSVQLLFLARIN